MGYAKFALDSMINKEAKALKNAENDQDRATAMNRMDELIALKKEYCEASNESLYKYLSLGVTLAGSIIPVVANRDLIRRCIAFEETGVWSHPSIKGLIGKIHIGK